MSSHVRLPRSHFDTTPLQFFDDLIDAQPLAEEGENELRPAASHIDADAEVLEASDHDLRVIWSAATRAPVDAAVRIEGGRDFVGPGAALEESFRELADVAVREETQSRTLAAVPDDFDLDLEITPPPEDDAFDEAPNQAFSILVGRRGRIPDEGIVLREGAQARHFVVRKRSWDDAQEEIVLGLPACGFRERGLELRLQEAEDAFISGVGRLQSFPGGLGFLLSDLPTLPEVSGAGLALVPKTIQRRLHQIKIETSQKVEGVRGDAGVDPTSAVVSTVAVSRVGSQPQADVVRRDPVAISPVAGVHRAITVATPDKPLEERRATQRRLLTTKRAALRPIADPQEAAVVDRIARTLVVAIADRAIVRIRGRLRLGGTTEVTPGVVILKTREDWYRDSHPGAADVFLILEVRLAGMQSDVSERVGVYSRSGVREVWVADVEAEALEVARDPDGSGGYRELRRHLRTESITLRVIPQIELRVGDLL